MSDREKDIEILALRHQLLVLQGQVGKPAFTNTDRAILVGLLHHLPIWVMSGSAGAPGRSDCPATELEWVMSGGR